MVEIIFSNFKAMNSKSNLLQRLLAAIYQQAVFIEKYVLIQIPLAWIFLTADPIFC